MAICARCGAWIQHGAVLSTACHQLHAAGDVVSAINTLRRLIPIHPRALIDSLLTYPRFLGTIKPQLLGRADAELGARIRSLGTAWWPRVLKCPVGSECLLSPLLHATGSKKTTAAAAVAAEGRFPMKTVAEVIGVTTIG